MFSIANLFPVRYPWDVCNDDKCCVMIHHPADIRVAWLVYVRKYGLPIATLNQNKRSRLLYLGDAQIILIIKIRQLIKTSDIMVPNLTAFVVNKPSL